jgi:very-short-patch-repair endonuclease
MTAMSGKLSAIPMLSRTDGGRSRSPLQRIIDSVTLRIGERITEVFESGDLPLESPIERIFIAALYAEVNFGLFGGDFDELVMLRPGTDISATGLESGRFFYVQLQAPILKYRADFLVEVLHPKTRAWRHLVVECDGHDYHERTKDQAANDRSRDRAMQSSGYTVFRFTGSEIHRDPMKCARQVVEWAWRASQ